MPCIRQILCLCALQVVYGGTDVKKDLAAMRRGMPDILIATPGRCWDIMTQDNVSACHVKCTWSTAHAIA